MSSYYTSEDDSMSPQPSNPLLQESTTCRVEILEQPLKKVRFRYLSELQGTPHGPLLGERSTKTNKTFPKVQLVGYDGTGSVKMRCWLVDKYETPNGEVKVRPHCHDLVVRKCIPRNDIVCEPHEIVVSRGNNYTAVFENMVVLHSVQKNSESRYMEKEINWNSRDTRSSLCNNRYDKKRIRDKIKSINKNEVYLYFEAYVETSSSVEVLCSALSNTIKNLKNPVSGDLKICRALNNFGPCDGNTEVGLFTEKVPPDVKVKFTCDKFPQWEKIVHTEFMHRNVAITFRTPSFPFNIDDDVRVQYCLFRESDGVESNAMDFTYQPCDYKFSGKANKRRRIEIINPIAEIPSPPLSYENGDSNSSDDMMNGGGLTLFNNPDIQLLLGEEVTEDLIYSVEGSIDGEIMKVIAEAPEDEQILENFSGNSLDRALMGGDPLIGGHLNTPEDYIESDGPTYGNVPVKVHGFMNSSNSKYRNKLEKIVKNVLLSRIYSDHVNCLQKAVRVDRLDLLKKFLSAIKEYSRLPNLNTPHRILSSLPTIVTKIRNDKCQTLLHIAVLLKRKDMVQVLLDFGYNPLDKDRSGNNAFHMSVMVSSCLTLQALISSCIEAKTHQNVVTTKSIKKLPSSVLSITNFEGQNILHLAVRSSSLDMVKYITGLKQLDVSSKVSNSGDSALHIACRLQKPDIALHLIQNGADLSQLNLQGYSPLHISVAINDHDMAKLLIKEKSDPTQECVSLMRDIQLDECCAQTDGDLSSVDKDLIVGDIYQSCDAFALANDLTMINILCGKVSSFKLTEEVVEEPLDLPSNKGVLLTNSQIERLSAVLSSNDSWRSVVRRLNKPHLEALCKGFLQPEKMLLSYIIQQKNEILGEGDQLAKLSEIFSSLNMNQANEILLSKED